MKTRLHDSSERAQIAEKARDALQQEYERVAVELVTREGEVGVLEQRVKSGDVRGREEMQQCQQVIDSLKLKLQESQEQYSTSQEQVKIVSRRCC